MKATRARILWDIRLHMFRCARSAKVIRTIFWFHFGVLFAGVLLELRAGCILGHVFYQWVDMSGRPCCFLHISGPGAQLTVEEERR